MQRRTLFKWLIGVASAAVASIIAVPPFISALAPAKRARESVWRPVGPVRRFPIGDVVLATVTPPPDAGPVELMPAQAVYVWQIRPAEVLVFSRMCTDLGCPVNYDEGSEFYYCPCHGGIFNKSGVPLAGPPSRPLYRYATRIRGGVLEIDMRSVPPMA